MAEVYPGITYNDLMILLKQEVKDITLEDLYDLSFYFNGERKYLPREYNKEYTETVLNVMMNRFISLKNDTTSYKGIISDEDIKKINELLNRNTNTITYLLNIIVIYATYYLKEPIHLPGTAFPGHVSIYCDGEDYFCPVKKYHINSNKSVCKYCIANIEKD